MRVLLVSMRVEVCARLSTSNQLVVQISTPPCCVIKLKIFPSVLCITMMATIPPPTNATNLTCQRTRKLDSMLTPF